MGLRLWSLRLVSISYVAFAVFIVVSFCHHAFSRLFLLFLPGSRDTAQRSGRIHISFRYPQLPAKQRDRKRCLRPKEKVNKHQLNLEMLAAGEAPLHLFIKFSTVLAEPF